MNEAARSARIRRVLLVALAIFLLDTARVSDDAAAPALLVLFLVVALTAVVLLQL